MDLKFKMVDKQDPNVLWHDARGGHLLSLQHEITKIEEKAKAAGDKVKEIREAKLEETRAAIVKRWEFGQTLAKVRGKAKQLPNGYTKLVVDQCGISERETRFRLQFFDKYPIKNEVGNALPTWTSWRQVTKSLPDETKPKKKKGTVAHLDAKQAKSSVMALKKRAMELTEAELKELDAIQELIVDIFEMREQVDVRRAR